MFQRTQARRFILSAASITALVAASGVARAEPTPSVPDEPPGATTEPAAQPTGPAPLTPPAQPAAPAGAPAGASAPNPDDDGRMPVTVGFVHPLATNANRPNVTSNFDFGALYGRVGRVEGLQLSGLAGYTSRGVGGAQIGGLAAITGGPATGLQLSGVTNVAVGDVAGAQISTVNVATERMDGAQIGVVNVGGKVRGLQLGLVNIAEEVDGAAIGLVSISRNSVHPLVWTSNLQYLNAGVKFSTKYVFTVLAAYIGTSEAGFDVPGITMALGGHVPLPADFDVEIQTSYTQLAPLKGRTWSQTNSWTAQHVVGGYRFAPHLRAFVGVGARVPVHVPDGREVTRPEVLAGVEF